MKKKSFFVECDNSDIYKKVDIAAAINMPLSDKSSDRDKEYLYIQSGLSYVRGIVLEELDELHESVFLEYNYFSSLLDKSNDGSINSFIYIDTAEDNSEFVDNIKNHTAPIINKLYDEGKTIYHHPDIFIDQKKIGPVVSIITDNKTDILTKEERYFVEKKRDEMVSGHVFTQLVEYEKYTSKDITKKITLGKLNFKRGYEEMLDSAKKIRVNEEKVTDAIYEYHKYYHQYFCTKKPSKSSIFISIPILGSKSSNHPKENKDREFTHTQGLSVVFIFLELDAISIDNLKEKIATSCINMFNRLNDFIRCFSYSYLFNVGMSLLDNAKRESIKSAKSAIMSRNMSHNLGSHVMFYIKQKLQSVNKIVSDGVLESLCTRDGRIDCNDIGINLSATEMPFLVGLGRFINYLQERQDYIATIATDYIPAKSTISFKDFIYDELKSDLRHKRHKLTNTPPGEEPKNLLLDYIAYSEKYEGSESIVIKFGEFDGSVDSAEIHSSDFEKLRKLNVALPGGVIARQAFFSIIENIIRNAAKHSRKVDQLIICFDVISQEQLDDKDLELLYVAPNNQKKCPVGRLKSADIKNLYLKNANKYEVLRITSLMQNESKSIDKLVENLAIDYIDINGGMDDRAKGLKEMRISAAWMRGYSIDLDIPLDKEPPAITVSKKEIKNGLYAIQYYICLPKPKRFAFIVDKEPHISIDIDSIGCKLFTDTNIYDKKNKKDSIKAEIAKEIADYDVVVFCSDKYQKLLIPKISSRHICFDKSNMELLKLLNIKNNDERIKKISEEVYSKWFTKGINRSQEKVGLSILDDKVTKTKTHNEDIGNDIYLATTGTADKEEEEIKDPPTYTYYEKKVIFSTHYGGGACSNPDLRGDKYKDAYFVEAISGNNSTDRLIRQNEWNAEWKYKHLAAGLQRIAIFDERIFSYVMPAQYQLKDYSQNSSDLSDVLIKFAEKKSKTMNSADFKKAVHNFIRECLSFINRPSCNTAIKKLLLNSGISNIKDEIIAVLDIAMNVHNIEKAQLFHEKRLWIFDIICKNGDKNKSTSSSVDFIGYNASIEDKIGSFDSSKRRIVTLATLSQTGGEYSLKFKENYLIKNKFDLISVHQGILDKIYELFGVKDNVEEKKKITNLMQDRFKNNSGSCNYNLNFIIHSGRSKPNTADMPQEVPFVQFAAIDHAVRDCKYTLSELLLTAHYE